MIGNKILNVRLNDWELENPIIPASGTFGYGHEHTKFYDINILGSFSMKGSTREPRFGNPLPRIAECENGIINSIGLQNPGIDRVVSVELKKLAKVYQKKIFANISGYTIDDYLYCATLLDNESIVGAIEVNVSCPNVPTGCKDFGTDAEALFQLISTLRAKIKKPIFVKFSPIVSDIVNLAKTAERAGANGICLINTAVGMRIDLKTGKPIVARKVGGYCGPAIKPLALRTVFIVSKSVKIPVVGIGGISNAEDVIEMMYAGATAVGIGTANLINPYVCKEIIEQLPAVMEKLNINRLSDIVGKAHTYE